MFVQFSQGLGPGCLRFSDRSIEVSPSLRLTVAKQPALALDQADVFLSSVQVPQFKLVAALAGIGRQSSRECIIGWPET